MFPAAGHTSTGAEATRPGAGAFHRTGTSGETGGSGAPTSPRRWVERAPVWLSRVVAVVGLVSLVSAAFPASRGRLTLLVSVLPTFAPSAARAATIGVAVLLLAVASGLRRRKRNAWLLATVLSAAAAVLHVVKGLDLAEALFAGTVCGLLIATRSAFPGRPDPRSWRRTGVVFGGSLLVAVAIGVGWLLIRADTVAGSPDPVTLLREVLLGMVGVTGPVRFTSGDAAADAAVTLAVLGGVTALLTVATLLRPARGPRQISRTDERRLRDLVRQHSKEDSLGYFVLRRDKSVVFSATGKAAVGYRVLGGVILASGDPVGDPEAWPGAIRAWLDLARRYAWTPAVLGASERGATAYHRAGLEVLELGDEAVVEVGDFTLSGRAMRGVRQAVGRLERAGYRCAVDRVDALPRQALAETRQAAVRYRDGDSERGFSMALGRLGDPADDGCVLVRGFDASGRVRGLLHLVPWGDDGLSLDVMRRDRESENGLVEFMVTSLINEAPALRVRRVSLNFATFRGVFARGERLGAGPVLRIWRRILLAASRFWQIESLYRANAKYRPVWEPRFLCYGSARELPRIGVAALTAEALLARPHLFRREPA